MNPLLWSSGINWLTLVWNKNFTNCLLKKRGFVPLMALRKLLDTQWPVLSVMMLGLWPPIYLWIQVDENQIFVWKLQNCQTVSTDQISVQLNICENYLNCFNIVILILYVSQPFLVCCLPGTLCSHKPTGRTTSSWPINLVPGLHFK